ncbi:restriction endonuclease subunit S [Pseudomonas aeruginosa]|uniref:restriction endonuclease subunit S n=1 Tax=Pseudomonas aeruginosa TaxID=287 RepID=UPI0029C023D7|nr:restriction endonuclease subunit S [Pseudomonas aeruginosa]
MNADVKPGYKQTEIGVIPDDWSVCELGDLAPYVTSGSRGWAEYYSDRGDPFIRITNLSRSTIYIDQADLKFVRIPDGDSEGQRTALIDGDLLISITADIGIIGYVDSSISKPAYINQHIALVRFKDLGVDSKYLSYFLAGEMTQRLFRSSTDQGAKAGMNLAGIRSIKAVLPPIAEQRAISAAMSEIDNLLSNLDQLIAKKRNIQQATMQQLLTGQRRLPGFSGEWKVMRLGEICTMKSGEGITSTNIDENSAYPCYGGNGLRGQTDTYTHDGSYVLIGRQGALCGNITFAQGKFFASEHAIVVTPSGQADVSWLSLILRKMNLNQYSESSAQPGLSVVKLLLLPCLVPPQPEQTAIAAILSDMDTELAALEDRRDKARQLKQGMMQELLTGRIRLV